MNDIKARLREILAIDKEIDNEEVITLLEKYGIMVIAGEEAYEDAETILAKLCLHTTINLLAMSEIAQAMTQSVKAPENDTLKEDTAVILAMRNLLHSFTLGRMKSILNRLIGKEELE
jgi:hypothetical protein